MQLCWAYDALLHFINVDCTQNVDFTTFAPNRRINKMSAGKHSRLDTNLTTIKLVCLRNCLCRAFSCSCITILFFFINQNAGVNFGQI